MSTPQPTDPHDRMAAVRAAMLTKARAKVYAQTDALGIKLTDEQADVAARRLLKQEQAERAVSARAALAAKRAERNADWAVRMAGMYAQQYVDHWGSYKAGDVKAVKREFYEAARVELYETPNGFNAHRLLRRFEAMLADARSRAWVTTAQLEATMVDGQPDWDSLPDLRELTGALAGDPVQ